MKHFAVAFVTAATLLATATSCTAHLPACTEMTWSDPTGGQIPPEHLDAESAVLWSEIAWTTDRGAAGTSPILTPCGDQVPCASVVRIIRNTNMGAIQSVERCAVKWMPRVAR